MITDGHERAKQSKLSRSPSLLVVFRVDCAVRGRDTKTLREESAQCYGLCEEVLKGSGHAKVRCLTG
jgi:hypothetical protein